MCGKYHTPCEWGEIISCQKVINKLFLTKNRLSKSALAAKVANFLSNGFWKERSFFLIWCQRLRYLVKMLLFWPSAMALPATFWTNFFFDTKYWRNWWHLFFQLNLLSPYSLCSQGNNNKIFRTLYEFSVNIMSGQEHWKSI